MVFVGFGGFFAFDVVFLFVFVCVLLVFCWGVGGFGVLRGSYFGGVGVVRSLCLLLVWVIWKCLVLLGLASNVAGCL